MFGKKTSIQQKLAFLFVLIIVYIIAMTSFLYINVTKTVRRMIYDKMNMQAQYYQEVIDREIQGTLLLQLEFFNNRRLPFLASPEIELNAYDEREYALSIRESIRTITESSSLVESGILYIPETEYYISSGTIRRMTESDFESMRYDLALGGYGGEKLQFDGVNYCSVCTDATGKAYYDNPHYVFILVFSSEEMKRMLALPNSNAKSGTFLYNRDGEVIIESYTADSSGSVILEKLKENNREIYESVQRIRVEGKDYLVAVGQDSRMGIMIQYIEEKSLMGDINRFLYLNLFFLAGLIILAVVFIGYTGKTVHRPLQILLKAFGHVKEGDLTEKIYHSANDEFAYIYDAFNATNERLSELVNEVYVQKNLAQSAQMKQLQAQINPHFLYNSFFILSRRIKKQDLEGAERLAVHLGNYFRYLTRDGADFIPLRQEYEHAKSYAAIQQDRFAGRIQIIFQELKEKYEGIMVPRLIIQPLLENSFEHGLENRVSDGILQVTLSEADGILQIKVEDNGEEADDHTLEQMRNALNEGNESGDVTGMVNIHRRLQICFKKEAGLRIERSGLGGAAVVIYLPSVGLDDC